MEYNFRAIETKWQKFWNDNQTFKTENTSDRPKYYVLDMFPYPSGAGLHVGHPLGYIATDIFSRYKRLKGFNVLHPMGFDAFGLPAEQYAIQTGRHPEETTRENIIRYREQFDRIGFCYDWSREVRTCEPEYYKWTQWVFLQLFNSWYNCNTQKAEPIATLIAVFEKEGFQDDLHHYLTGDIEYDLQPFSAEQWKQFSEKEKSDVLLNFRLAYLSEAWVNWCAGLGTVLANDEVKDGVSERGGYPVERKRMPQWSLRITAYAERLLRDLDTLDWTESTKEAQRNWIGRSEGTSLKFKLDGHDGFIEVFTTRPDTIFGVSFLTIAPEHELVNVITTNEYRDAVATYATTAKNKSERERQAEVKKVTGQFTGAYVLHPFTGARVPVWVGEYVLAGYGTGAVMAVPGHDARDYAFAKHFSLPIIEVVKGGDLSVESYDAKTGELVNSDFLNGLEVKAAVRRAIEEIEKRGLGKGKINHRLRDAAFGRQRYWGEPIPIYYKDGVPCALDETELPLILPQVDKFLPTETGEPPLARAKDWKYKGQYDYEWTTMPGWAGSSWYFLRYMDPKNEKEFVSAEAANYWGSVDLYLGGSEHATGHLLYVRFWTKFLYDIGKIPMVEPAQKLINQGMIQGVSQYVFRLSFAAITREDSRTEPKKPTYNTSKFPAIMITENSYKKINSLDEKDSETKELLARAKQAILNVMREKEPENEGHDLHTESASSFTVDISLVDANGKLDIDKFRKSRAEFADAIFLEGEPYFCKPVVEKMSKRWGNVVNPDDICNQYGADTLRLYEMFLGPIDQSKPWNTNGISGTYNFLRKFWRLVFDNNNQFQVSEEAPTKAELKVLHKTLKKIAEDVERFAFNTCVSSFMIAVNELGDLKCHKRAIIEPLVIALSPFAPHIAEELWSQLGHTTSVCLESYPAVDESYLIEDTFDYPVQVNGKVRFKHAASLKQTPQEVETDLLASEEAAKWLEGKTPKKVVVVPGRIINIVL